MPSTYDHGGTMRRTVLLTLALTLALTGCAGGGKPEAAAPVTSSSSSAATTTAAPVLGEGDVYACQSFVADQEDAYEWLTLLERQGTIGADEAWGGKLKVYNMGGVAQLYLGQIESAPLREALQLLWDQQDTTRADLDAGTLSPTPLREALDQAADVCQEGGFVISWYEV